MFNLFRKAPIDPSILIRCLLNNKEENNDVYPCKLAYMMHPQLIQSKDNIKISDDSWRPKGQPKEKYKASTKLILALKI